MVILFVVSHITTMRVWLTNIVGMYTIGNSVLIMMVLTRSIMVINIVIASIVTSICIHQVTLLDTYRTITIITITTIMLIIRWDGVLITIIQGTSWVVIITFISIYSRIIIIISISISMSIIIIGMYYRLH